MTPARPIIAILFFLIGIIPVAALDWQQRTLDAHAEPFQKTVTLAFEFKNGGTRPVHILDLKTSCSCLSAASEKSSYAPGETGKIHAEFSTTETPGLYERQINVLTDESESPQQLIVRIEIPELAILTPRSLDWRLNENVEEKSVELRANGTLRIDFTESIPSNDSFVARLEPVEPGRVYRLVIRPHRTTAVANAAVRIHGHDSAGHEILISAYANVR